MQLYVHLTWCTRKGEKDVTNHKMGLGSTFGQDNVVDTGRNAPTFSDNQKLYLHGMAVICGSG
jgi:hypothetical protein